MNIENYKQLLAELQPSNTRLVAVSKTKPATAISALYAAGQKDFGENKVQEIVSKHAALPSDIRWHLIGHLQSNKVKQIASFITLIHSVDSLKLLEEINRQAAKHERVIDCLLQIFIAKEETKFGLTEIEIHQLLTSETFLQMKHVRICGLMAMATFTDDEQIIAKEFSQAKRIFEKIKKQYFSGKDFFNELSMGMSADYKIALRHGSTMVRVGSTIFGSR